MAETSVFIERGHCDSCFAVIYGLGQGPMSDPTIEFPIPGRVPVAVLKEMSNCAWDDCEGRAVFTQGEDSDD